MTARFITILDRDFSYWFRFDPDTKLPSIVFNPTAPVFIRNKAVSTGLVYALAPDGSWQFYDSTATWTGTAWKKINAAKWFAPYWQVFLAQRWNGFDDQLPVYCLEVRKAVLKIHLKNQQDILDEAAKLLNTMTLDNWRENNDRINYLLGDR